MCSKLAALGVLCALIAGAQSLSHKIDLGKDPPVALLSANFDNSRATPRGGAYQVDVQASLSLRNSSQKRIRSVVLAVQTSDLTAGGKASVSLPTLNVGPGEAFPVRIELSLLRPLPEAAGGPAVEVKLDGVLFDDLSFYGPDTRNSRRAMTLWELQARRDREYFKTLLETAGVDALRKEMVAALARRGDRWRPDVQMGRGRQTNVDAEKEVQFAFLEIPESPVSPLSGAARVSASQARSPHFEIRNRSSRPVEHLEIAWLVKDQQGREYLAASVGADVKLAPNQSGHITQDTELRFEQPVSIQGMRGFVSSVEFAGGSYWIPSRSALAIPGLREVVAPSPEEQRLLQIYSRKGLDALVDELRKF
jgi:hypothetical protein